MLEISEFIRAWPVSPFGDTGLQPWEATARARSLLGSLLDKLDQRYSVHSGVAVHKTATVEPGAILKSPAVIGPNTLVAATAYLRGGVFLDCDCTVGPGCELKTTFMFKGSKIAHLSFVGDSLIGQDVNIEAGAVIANYRNELDNKRIWIRWRDKVIDTGVEKFGAVVGDGTRVGANAVIAPGALIYPGAQVPRLALIDQRPAGIAEGASSSSAGLARKDQR